MSGHENKRDWRISATQKLWYQVRRSRGTTGVTFWKVKCNLEYTPSEELATLCHSYGRSPSAYALKIPSANALNYKLKIMIENKSELQTRSAIAIKRDNIRMYKDANITWTIEAPIHACNIRFVCCWLDVSLSPANDVVLHLVTFCLLSASSLVQWIRYAICYSLPCSQGHQY